MIDDAEVTSGLGNDNVDYEKFAQEIYQTLIDSEGVYDISVKHNVNLTGRSGCKHQIDVYWEYNIGGETYKVAIECKNYSTSNISIGKIRDFYGALQDIGNINGIFVCKEGYQSGAKSFAGFYGINLKELRVPNDSDWEGRIRNIKLNIISMSHNIKSRNISFDQDWFKGTYSNLMSGQEFTLAGYNKDIKILDFNKVEIANMYNLDNGLPNLMQAGENYQHVYKWDEAYLNYDGLGLVKINSIEYIYDVIAAEPVVSIMDGKAIAKAILKDVETGAIKFFDVNGGIR